MLNESISRRGLLECAARLAALPAGLQMLSRWSRAAEPAHQHGGTAPPDPNEFENYQPQFFSPADYDALQSITELLIPTDETPGAREAHCAAFIDFVLHANGDFAPETQKQWRATMKTLREAGYHKADAPGRVALLREMARPEIDPSVRHSAYAAYRLIKRENTFAFYTAHAGMIEALDYRGNSYNLQFPACTHPEHHRI